MNAPDKAVAAAITFAQRVVALPIDEIMPSDSAVQQLRRAHFNAEYMQQLADNIKAIGVLQNITVHELTPPRGKARYMIIAGERRWLAAKMAGLKTIPSLLCVGLQPAQVLELQLVENLQRESLHELEEAEGFRELMAQAKLTADDIAKRINKSRSHVFKRLQLLKLCPEARAALYDGKLQPTIAGLVARVPHHDTQRQLLKQVALLTFRAAQELIQREFMIDLKVVTFKLDDAQLLPKAGACTTCPKRTGNQKDLFADIKNPNVCTDPHCLQAKTDAQAKRARDEAEANGDKVISGAEAKKLKPYRHSDIAGSYVGLDDEEYIGGQYRSWGKALGKDLPPVTLLECPHTRQLLRIVKRDAAVAALKKRGIKIGISSSSNSGRDAAKEREARIETEARVRILNAARAGNAKRKLTIDDTRMVAQSMIDRLGFDLQKRLVDARNAAAGIAKPKGHDYVYALEKRVPAMDAGELALLMLDIAAIGDVHVAPHWRPDGKALAALAARAGVNAAKIRAEVKAEFAAKQKPAAKTKAKKKGAAK